MEAHFVELSEAAAAALKERRHTSALPRIATVLDGYELKHRRHCFHLMDPMWALVLEAGQRSGEHTLPREQRRGFIGELCDRGPGAGEASGQARGARDEIDEATQFELAEERLQKIAQRFEGARR